MDQKTIATSVRKYPEHGERLPDAKTIDRDPDLPSLNGQVLLLEKILETLNSVDACMKKMEHAISDIREHGAKVKFL